MNAQSSAAAARRSPTPQDLVVWREFAETGERLRSMLDARLQAESGLSRGDYLVLLALTEAGGAPVRSSEVASIIGWERSRLSHHLGRMEARGVITRHQSRADSRGAEVALTADGARQFRRASAAHLRAVQELFLDALSPQLLSRVRELTDALGQHWVESGAAVPGSAESP